MPPRAAHRGQRRLSERRELALDELALDLQSDHEEEQRHEAVVDPAVEVE
jgi:hypothetical protein